VLPGGDAQAPVDVAVFTYPLLGPQYLSKEHLLTWPSHFSKSPWLPDIICLQQLWSHNRVLLPCLEDDRGMLAASANEQQGSVDGVALLISWCCCLSLLETLKEKHPRTKDAKLGLGLQSKHG
jgi:hypothetical protein